LENFIHSIQKIGDIINKACRFLLGIVTVALSVIVIGQMLLRQVNISFTWASEVSCLLFVVQTMLGSAVASRYLLHIGVDIIINCFHGASKKVMLLISNVVMIISLAIFTMASIMYTISQVTHTGVSFSFSIAWFYMSLPICGVTMIYHSLVQLFEIIFYGEPVRVPLPEDIQNYSATEVTE